MPLADVRPVALLLPNLAAIAVCFLPINGDDPPIGPILEYIGRFTGSRGHSNIWEAFITGPFLLSIPLAIWTIRLCIRPRIRRRESIIAWAMTTTALTMTLIAAGYTTLLIARYRRFAVAVLASLAILVAGAMAVWRLRAWKFAYPPALLAMTAVYAANVVLTILVVTSHAPWQSGSIGGAIVVAGQVLASALLFVRVSRAR